MDLLKLLKDKAEYFAASSEDSGVNSIVAHIDVAEKHFQNGKSGEDYLFNDVIYRSNQAFEGALKEAYRILHGKITKRITPYQIEKYFEEDDVLKERVLNLFKNYREEWRNKSTHDYKLYFSEQEAFLAIVNISAFVNILFDQMIEKKAFDNEMSQLKSRDVKPIQLSENQSLAERATELLKTFSLEVPEKARGAAIPYISESEITGALMAFFKSIAEDIVVYSEYPIAVLGRDRQMRADFLLESKEESLIIEIKNARKNTDQTILQGTEQLISYLVASKTKNGILYIPPLWKTDEMVCVESARKVGDIEYKIVQIYPNRKRK